MQEILAQVFGYVAGLWRFRWLGLVLAWVVALSGWFWVSQMPDQYMATARVHVDTNSILRPLLRGLAVQPDINQRVALMSRTLLSRPNLEKLVRMTDMDIQVKTEAQKEALLASLAKSISLSGDRRNASLYSISFHHKDREFAKKVVQALISVFVESSVGEKAGDTGNAQSFLDKQIAEYEKRLTDAESALASFKQKHASILMGEGGSYYQRLVSARQELSQARLQLKEMQNRRNELKRQLSGEQPVFMPGASSQGATSLDGRINSLKAKLDDLLSKYTDKHPEVVQINNLISELERERSDELAKVKAGDFSDLSGLSVSPVYQQMRAMLAEAEANVAELSVRVSEYQARVDSLDQMVDQIPVIEAQLTQLNRDYDVVSQQHTELLERRESARISEDVEQQGNDLIFKVVDPPFVPLKPNKPDKFLLNGGVLVISLLVGVGVALLFTLLKPVISDRRRLAAVTGMPVLGAVMCITTESQRRRVILKNVQFVTLFLCLFVAYAGVSVGHQWGLI
ncbi:MAG: GNVR domain-containing protein [Porticoccaceae bacterium]